MFCVVCGELYVGETERPVRERLADHYREARVDNTLEYNHYEFVH